MPESGSAQPTDYYAALGLNPAAPPHALLAQLSHRIAQTPPGSDRHLAEQARAILGDPAKRAIYDQRLRDPQAPPWTPQELHELALAQLSRPTTSGGIAGKITAIPRRILAAVTSGLVLVLALVVTLVSCTGGSADTGTSANTHATGASGDSKPAPKDCIAFTGLFDKDDLNEAAWNRGAKPDYTLVLTNAYQLPEPVGSELAQLAGSHASGLALRELRNGDIMVNISDMNHTPAENRKLGGSTASNGFGRRTAYFNDQGELVYTYEFKDPSIDVPVPDYEGAEDPYDSYERVSSVGKTSHGLFRMAAKDGIDIPAKASNSTTDGKYALDVLTTGDDIWLLLRGGTALYEARLVKTSNGVDPTSCV